LHFAIAAAIVGIIDAATVSSFKAENGLQGRTEGHAGMDIFIHDGTVWQRITSSEGRTAISHRGLRHQGITRDS
jgi:hypothetical protein